MNVTVDIGNTFTKVGIFEGTHLVHKEVFRSMADLRDYLGRTPADHIIVSSVSGDPYDVLNGAVVKGKKLVLHHQLRLPIKINYATPTTLGVDRIAAACGAQSLYPGQACLVVDIGTCINYEFIDAAGTYSGGAISPGVQLRFESMHSFTSRLPLATAVENAPLTGDSTLGCLQSGVMNGILEEINGMMDRYAEITPQLRVILCGGDSRFFEKHCKRPIFVAPDLVLTGLNSILRYHEAS
ncbi:MAG: type III pantothenate kinase [Bacteroidetes bacterium]|nr:type III pantothenate kinase [Bacteroidota bacterium]